MALYRLVFDRVISFPFMVTVICVRTNTSVRTCVLNDILINSVVKGVVFEFIVLGHTKNDIVLCELFQDCFEFVVILKNQIPHVNVMKKVWWEGIKMCEIFG